MDRLLTVIPTFNAERFLRETLDSIAGQTLRPDRVIVLDNGSTDGTKNIVNAFQDLKCEWIQNESNWGLFGNLNRALEWASSTCYLHLLHADDLILDSFYKECTSQLPDAGSRGLIYCCTELIDEHGRPISFLGVRHTQPEHPSGISDFLSRRAELRPAYSPSVLLKTAGMPAPCTFREDLPHVADLVFWSEWSAHSSEIAEVPRILCRYRIHTGSETGKNTANIQSWMLDEWKAMCIIENLRVQSLWRRRIRFHKLLCAFAARSMVKITTVRDASPHLAERMSAEIKNRIPFLHRTLAAVAVFSKYRIRRQSCRDKPE